MHFICTLFFSSIFPRKHKVGTDLDHKIKAAAADGEAQWDGLGEATGLKIWRIEQFKVVPWPEFQYGSFHTGDSYVVLNSYQKDGSDAILHDIHSESFLLLFFFLFVVVPCSVSFEIVFV